MKKKILFLCTHNSGRSQMAEAFINGRWGRLLDASSAGTEPSDINPYVRRAMAEVGFDLSGHRSKGVEEFLGREFDFIVTLCDQAQEACPYFPGSGRRMHQNFDDPALCRGTEEEVMDCVRRIRDDIEAWVGQTFGRGNDLLS